MGFSATACAMPDCGTGTATAAAALSFACLTALLPSIAQDSSARAAARAISENITTVGGDVKIYGNPNLAQCLVDAFVAALEAAGGLSAFGSVDTEDNNDECTCTGVPGAMGASCP